MNCQPKENICAFTLHIGNLKYIVNVKPEEAKNGAKIPIPTSTGSVVPIEIIIMKKPQDDLYNYVLQFMQ
jgi:hypothetical protein